MYQSSYFSSLWSYQQSKLIKLCVFLALLFNFFPWTSFSLNSYDMQPWVIFLDAVVIFLLIRTKVHAYIFFSYLIFGFVLVVAILDGSDYVYRAVASYMILFLGLHFFYLICKSYLYVFLCAVFFSNIIWVLMGLYQFFFGVDSFSFLVNLRSSADRGVTSLAPEPTHFGLQLIFFSWIILILSQVRMVGLRCAIFFVIIDFLSVVFLAKSSMAVMYILIFLPFFYMARGGSLKSIFLLFGFLLFFCFFGLVYFNSYPESRLALTFSGLFSDPLLVLKEDASINSRVSHLFLSMYGAFSDLFYPHGFSAFNDHSYVLNREFDGFFWYNYQSNIIMSGLGSLLYEVGILGLSFLLITFFFMMGWSGFNKYGFFSFFLLWIFMAGAMPVSYPMLPAIIVLVYFVVSGRARRMQIGEKNNDETV